MEMICRSHLGAFNEINWGDGEVEIVFEEGEFLFSTALRLTSFQLLNVLIRTSGNRLAQ